MLSAVITNASGAAAPEASRVLDDFSNAALWSTSRPSATVTVQTDRLKEGRQGLRVSFPADTSEPFRLNVGRHFSTVDWVQHSAITCWVYPTGVRFPYLEMGGWPIGRMHWPLKPNQWNHIRWEFPRNWSMWKSHPRFRFRFATINSGRLPEDESIAVYDICDLRLETAPERHKAGWQVARGQVVVSHLGYRPASRKIALLHPDEVKEGTPFQISNSSDTVVFRGTCRHISGPTGRHAVCDFSDLREPGTYRVLINKRRSRAFCVDPAAFEPLVRLELRYLQCCRCGQETDCHGLCHSDDGIREDNRMPKQVIGGYHDAGGVRKYLHANGVVPLQALLFAHRALGVEHAALRAELLSEMRWAAGFVMRMQEPSGRFVSHMRSEDTETGNKYDTTAVRWTDNKPGTRDDRLIATGEPWFYFRHPHHYLQAVHALVGYANETVSTDREEATRATAAALRAWEYITKKETNTRTGEWPQTSAEGALAMLELYRATTKEKWRRLAIVYLNDVLRAQVRRSESGFAGFFRTHWKKGDSYSPKGGSYYSAPAIALAQACEYLPDHVEAVRWRQALQRWKLGWVEQCAKETAPYGIVCDGLYESPPKGRVLVDRRGSYGFGRSPSRFMTLIGTALAAGMAGRALDDPSFLIPAENQLQYLLGVNPFDVSVPTGMGENNPIWYSFSRGLPPGGIGIGFGVTNQDTPGYWPFGQNRGDQAQYRLEAELYTAGAASLLAAAAQLASSPSIGQLETANEQGRGAP
jgi:hypothetical protein